MERLEVLKEFKNYLKEKYKNRIKLIARNPETIKKNTYDDKRFGEWRKNK